MHRSINSRNFTGFNMYYNPVLQAHQIGAFMIPPKILALIPAYNEAAAIREVIIRVSVHLPVLVVDDGSRDETANIAETAGARVLRQAPNQGKGTALRAGFRQALDEQFDAVLTLDADGQHDPAEIPLFLEAFRQNQAHLVIGQRTFKEMPLVRRLANTLGSALFSWAMRQPVHDNQSGYRLISRPVMESCLASREEGFEFEVEMITTCVRQGLHLAWVPIRTIYGEEKSHIQPLQHTLNFMRMVWKTRRATARRGGN
jgi:glycosyltransferase involved in cell wall biosynthesis